MLAAGYASDLGLLGLLIVFACVAGAVYFACVRNVVGAVLLLVVAVVAAILLL
jgi:hypothetical protein